MQADDTPAIPLDELMRNGFGNAAPSPGVPCRHPHVVTVEDDRTGVGVETIRRAFLDNLYYVQGATAWNASRHDLYMALARTLRDRLMHRWMRSVETIIASRAKVVCYLSSEFLMGRQLENCLHNLDLWHPVHHALAGLGLKLHDLVEAEPEPGLGNGGLGRLAACFLDSLATLDMPAFGYGIRYEFGIFEQRFEHGWQVERPDKWLRLGNPWEIERPVSTVEVKFGGRTAHGADDRGRLAVRWLADETVIGTAYDTLVPGYDTNLINTLRLWSASSSNDFDFGLFEAGDYSRAVAAKTASENISKVLYPNDNAEHGRELRLRQQYFFVSCSLQDILRMQRMVHGTLDGLRERCAIQLNDTHPAIAVAELMRLLVDEHGYGWERAWETTEACLGYTNHTLLAEALETWPVELFERLLPRHVEIIYEINRRFLETVRARYPGDEDRVRRMSIVQETPDRRFRMSHLATVGSHAVNGVAALHSDLLRRELLKDFHDLWPEKFTNKTNGVTPRRWMLVCNPKLAFLITETLGTGWLKDLERLRGLEGSAGDPAFRQTWQAFKQENKRQLAAFVASRSGVSLDVGSMFDVQVKRIHEYKRQLLLALYIVTLYLRLKDDPARDLQPRTFVFGGKAAPGYAMAKLVIKLINSVAGVVNLDPDVRDRLKVVFLENFSVSLGELVYPAADLSEQISMAGKEASGTGNMKAALNGALTIGTYDGANIEIREAVGAENFFLFGLRVNEIAALRARGYDPRAVYERNRELRRAIDALASGVFSDGDRGLFRPVVESLLSSDPYLVMADYEDYVATQEQVSAAFGDPQAWTRTAILNVARMGRFSSDRTIREYCADIWGVTPVSVGVGEYDAETQVQRFRDFAVSRSRRRAQ